MSDIYIWIVGDLCRLQYVDDLWPSAEGGPSSALEEGSGDDVGMLDGADVLEPAAVVAVVETGIGGPGVEPEPCLGGLSGSKAGPVDDGRPEPRDRVVGAGDHPVQVEGVVGIVAARAATVGGRRPCRE